MKKNFCDHPHYDFELLPEQFDDTNVRMISLSARCRVCGDQARFLGVDEGLSLRRPSSSTDGTRIMLPTLMGVADIEVESARAH